MKIITLIVLILMISTSVFAYTIHIPFRCRKKLLVEEFAKEGVILDISDENAQGFIENKGSEYTIYLYDAPDERMWELLKDIPLKIEGTR